MTCDSNCCNWDIDEMQKAIDAPSYRAPDGVSLREWLIEVANNTDAENEKYLANDQN